MLCSPIASPQRPPASRLSAASPRAGGAAAASAVCTSPVNRTSNGNASSNPFAPAAASPFAATASASPAGAAPAPRSPLSVAHSLPSPSRFGASVTPQITSTRRALILGCAASSHSGSGPAWQDNFGPDSDGAPEGATHPLPQHSSHFPPTTGTGGATAPSLHAANEPSASFLGFDSNQTEDPPSSPKHAQQQTAVYGAQASLMALVSAINCGDPQSHSHFSRSQVTRVTGRCGHTASSPPPRSPPRSLHQQTGSTRSAVAAAKDAASRSSLFAKLKQSGMAAIGGVSAAAAHAVAAAVAPVLQNMEGGGWQAAVQEGGGVVPGGMRYTSHKGLREECEEEEVEGSYEEADLLPGAEIAQAMAAHEAQQLVAYLSHEDVGLVQGALVTMADYLSTRRLRSYDLIAAGVIPGVTHLGLCALSSVTSSGATTESNGSHMSPSSHVESSDSQAAANSSSPASEQLPHQLMSAAEAEEVLSLCLELICALLSHDPSTRPGATSTLPASQPAGASAQKVSQPEPGSSPTTSGADPAARGSKVPPAVVSLAWHPMAGGTAGHVGGTASTTGVTSSNTPGGHRVCDLLLAVLRAAVGHTFQNQDQREGAGGSVTASTTSTGSSIHSAEDQDGISSSNTASWRAVPAAFFAASAIVRLAKVQPAARHLIRHGAVTLLGRALSHHDPMLSQVAVFALYKLLKVGSHADNLVQLMQAGGGTSLLALMARLEGSPTSATTSTTTSVQKGSGTNTTGSGANSASQSADADSSARDMASRTSTTAAASGTTVDTDSSARDMAASILLDMALLPEAPAHAAETGLVARLVQLMGGSRPVAHLEDPQDFEVDEIYDDDGVAARPPRSASPSPPPIHLQGPSPLQGPSSESSSLPASTPVIIFASTGEPFAPLQPFVTGTEPIASSASPSLSGAAGVMGSDAGMQPPAPETAGSGSSGHSSAEHTGGLNQQGIPVQHRQPPFTRSRAAAPPPRSVSPEAVYPEITNTPVGSGGNLNPSSGLPSNPRHTAGAAAVTPTAAVAPTDPVLRLYALLVLARLANHSRAVQMDAVREGVVGPLVAMMGGSNEDEALHAARLSAILAQSTPTHEALTSDEMLGHLLSLLSSNSASVLEHGASVFAILANNPGTHFKMVGWGAVPLLISLLGPSTRATPKCQTYVLATLMLLAMHEPRHADVVCRAGALPRLVSILNSSSFVNVEEARAGSGTSGISGTCTSNSTTSGTVQEYAAAVLSCLSRTTDAQAEIIAAGGIPALVKLLKAGQQPTPWGQGGSTVPGGPASHGSAPGTWPSMSHTSGSGHTFSHTSGHTFGHSYDSSSSSLGEAQGHAAEALTQLAAVAVHRKRLVVRAAEILPAICALLGYPGTSATSRYWGASLLHLMCQDDAVLLEAGDMEEVRRALAAVLADQDPQLGPEARRAQVQAAWVVARLCTSAPDPLSWGSSLMAQKSSEGATLLRALVAMLAAGLDSAQRGMGGGLYGAGGAGDASAKDGSSAPAPTTLQGAASEPAGKKTRPRAFRVEPLDSNASAAATAALLALARISPVVKRQVEAELLFQEVWLGRRLRLEGLLAPRTA